MKNAAIGTTMCALHNGACLVQCSAFELNFILNSVNPKKVTKPLDIEHVQKKILL
jgi:hypothetical protein